MSWTRRLLLSIPELLTFVIDFSQMSPRILLIPSETLFLWLSSLRPRVGNSMLLPHLIWRPNWGQLLWIDVCWLIRAKHSGISTSKSISFALISLQHRSILWRCIVSNCGICRIKLIHVLLILDKWHLGSRHQSSRFVTRPFRVA